MILEGTDVEVVAILDNGGKTYDRYTVFFEEAFDVPKYDENYGPFSYCYGMSESPFHPQGFCCFAGEYSYRGPESWEHIGHEVEFDSLPEQVKRAIHSIAKS